MPAYLSAVHYRQDDHVHYCEDDEPIMLKSYADEQDSHTADHHNTEPQPTANKNAQQKQVPKHEQQMHPHSHHHQQQQQQQQQHQQHHHQQQPQPQSETQHYLTIEELRVAFNSCWLCGCNWLQDHISLDCPECGGYALTRPCPNCDGKCKQTWKRNITATHDLQRAHWSGHCSLSNPIKSLSEFGNTLEADKFLRRLPAMADFAAGAPCDPLAAYTNTIPQSHSF